MHQTLCGLVAGREARGIFGRLGQIAFAGRKDRCRLARGFGQFCQPVALAVLGAGQLVKLPFQTGKGFAGIAVQPGLAFGVALQLGDAGAQGFHRLAGPRFLIGQGIALHHQSLKDRPRDRLFLAQRRQAILGGLTVGRGLAGRRLGHRGQTDRLGQLALGKLAGGIGLVPAAKQQHAFGAAQIGANLAVTRGLPGLARQCGQLLGKLFQHVIHTGQVGFGGGQPQLCLVAALIQAADPRRLFQHTAAAARLGVDQFGNLPLPHQRRRMRAGRGIKEQHLHILGPHFLAIGAVGRPGIAGDAAADFQQIRVVEPRGRQPVGIVDAERDLGKVARAPRGGAGEDHILHLAAAHGGGAILAHHPAQRLEQIGFSAAVRPDDPGQAISDHQLCRIDKAFEAVQSQAGESQRALRWQEAPWS